MTTPQTPVPNVPLLRKVWEHINVEPGTWHQGAWRSPIDSLLSPFLDNSPTRTQELLQAKQNRCSTAMCIAGHAADMAGGIWFERTPGLLSKFLLAEPDDDPYAMRQFRLFRTGVRCDELSPPVVSVDYRAQRLLGLTFREATELFSGNNTKADIKEIIERIIGEPL